MLVLFGGVVDDNVDPDLDVVIVCSRHEGRHVRCGAVLPVHRPEHERHVSPVIAFRGIELVDRQELEDRDAKLGQPGKVGRHRGERAGIFMIETHGHTARMRLGNNDGPCCPALELGSRPLCRHGPGIRLIPFVMLAEPDLCRHRVNKPGATVDEELISTQRRDDADPLVALAPKVHPVAVRHLDLDRFGKRRPHPHVEHAAVWPLRPKT